MNYSISPTLLVSIQYQYQCWYSYYQYLVIASLAASKNIGVDASVLTELEGIFVSKEKQRMVISLYVRMLWYFLCVLICNYFKAFLLS